MAKYVFCCPQLSFVPSERLVNMLLSEEYRSLIEQYRYILSDDPDYFRFHCTSTALKLQFALKLHNLPDLKISACNGLTEDGCCIIDALEEAIKRCPVDKHAATAA